MFVLLILMLLKPFGFAVIGASSNQSKVGGSIFNNLLKSSVKVFPVNPNHRSINGVKCYSSITELSGLVSHAIIAVPAKIVPKVMRDCVKAGVKYAVIISSGFSEVGDKSLEEEVISIARSGGVRVLGPNVLGLIKPGEFNASFFNGSIKSGGISFISQSGALGVGVLDSFILNDWSLRFFISVGNTADLTITSVLKELLVDEGTNCVIIYAESLKQGREFMSVCKSSRKPVFILKAGTSEEGVRASASHTGSLAGSDVIYSAAFKQCGVVRVNSLTSLINHALLFERFGRLGSRALIITNAGGPGILMTDALVSNGLKISRIPSMVVKLINDELVNVNWSHNNPIDLVGDARADRYSVVLDLVKDFNFYDFIIVLLTPQSMTEPLKTAKVIVDFHKNYGKPVIPCFIGGASVIEAVNFMKSNGLIVFNEIEDLASAVSGL